MSVFLGRRKPGSVWLASDSLAALAWQSYADSLCSGCGQPRHESMDKANADRYLATTMACFSCRAVEQRREAMGKNGDVLPGIYMGSTVSPTVSPNPDPE